VQTFQVLRRWLLQGLTVQQFVDENALDHWIDPLACAERLKPNHVEKAELHRRDRVFLREAHLILNDLNYFVDATSWKTVY
jgi:hypothetical protein